MTDVMEDLRIAFGGPWTDADAAREKLTRIIDRVATGTVLPSDLGIQCDLVNHPDSIQLPGIGTRVMITVTHRHRADRQLSTVWPLLAIKDRPGLVADEVARMIRLVTEVLSNPALAD